jgi:hypothetical protein
MKKTFPWLVILLLLFIFFWLCSVLLSNVLAKNLQPPQRSITTSGKVSSLFTVNNTDQTTVLAYSSAAGLPTFHSINWNIAANNAGMLDQSTTNSTFSSSSGTINTIIESVGTSSGFYLGVITIAGCYSPSSYTNRFGLIRIPTVRYIIKMHKSLILTAKRFMPAINNIFTLVVA